MKASTTNNDRIPITTKQIELTSGTTAETMTAIPKRSLFQKTKPPLLFIHGSFHASWCWAEHYLPHFASLGYHSSALSLRGTGGTFAGEGVTKVNIMDHVNDIHAFIEYTTQETNAKPVIISHSFGGLAIMKLLEREKEIQDRISGIALLCSVPPSGNGKMTMRFLRRSFKDAWTITSGFVLKTCITDETNCRKLFFGGVKDDDDMGITDQDLERYQSYFARDTVATIDLRDLSNKLPSKITVDGVAPFIQSLPPVLVVGASDDFIVDRVGVEETAKYFGVEALFVDSPHDVMLGRCWRNCAGVIQDWLDNAICK